MTPTPLPTSDNDKANGQRKELIPAGEGLIQIEFSTGKDGHSLFKPNLTILLQDMMIDQWIWGISLFKKESDKPTQIH